MRRVLPADFRHAWRSIAASPAASTAIVLVVTVGVGLTAAMFALTDPYLLRPLPYADPDRLVMIE